MKWSSFCLLGMVVLLNACHKTTVTDPAVNQYPFSCKVNGQLWFPASEADSILVDLSNFSSPGGTTNIFTISATKTTGERITLGNVGLKVNAYTEIKYINAYSKTGCGTYVPDATKVNFIKTTSIDSVQGTISGIFQVECNSADCTKNIKITEGRFTVSY